MKNTYWLVEAEAEVLKPFYDGIDKFCSDYLPTGESEIDESSFKIFADPVEGYVHLAAWEVAIVDTPLFQRLRTIKQLGLADLVYPSLGYCRFQHTLGVMARLKQISDQLSENHILRFGEEGRNLLSENYLVTIRLAALCHDIGHCIFSHVSESVIAELEGHEKYPSSSVIMQKYSEYAGRKIPIAEIFSVAILTSRPFIDFLNTLDIPGASKLQKVVLLAQNAARLILGLPLDKDPQSLFLGQLMSSGFDVDKLDYMLRESHFSGISLGISLEWVLKKLYVNTVKAEELPKDLRLRVRDYKAGSDFGVLSIAKGGQFAFEEFCVARLTLHEKIYLHQKIRAAEAFVKSNLRKLAVEFKGHYDECHRWLYLKESQFDFPSQDLPALPEIDLLNRSQIRGTKGLNLTRIRERKLLCRAFAFGWFNAIAEPLISEPLRDSRTMPNGTDQLIDYLGKSQDKFIDSVKKHLAEMRQMLDEDDCPKKECSEILIDLPRLSTLQQGHETIYIEHPSRLSLRWTMPIDRIVEYYHKHRALAYVFTERAYCACVLLAVEKAVWEQFGVIYVQDAAINSKIVERAKMIKIHLHTKNFYADARQLQPISEYLSAVYPQTLVSRIARKLAHYESRSKKWVTPASVTTYISQFPANLQEVALEWLQHINWIDPGSGIEKALSKVLLRAEFANATKIGLCPLGSASDSATHIAYKIKDAIRDDTEFERIKLLQLSDALARKQDAYIIYDDNTNTGYQALNIIAAWLNEDIPEKYRLNEDHVQALHPDLKAEFLSKPVAFVFAVGTDGSDMNLINLISSHTSFDKKNVVCVVSDILENNTKIFSGSFSSFQHKNRLDLQKFVQGVAKEIFMNEGRDETKAMQRSLGDGGSEAMVVFPYNCPTMTIPALWLCGRYQGHEWLPLVERARQRDPATGLPVGEDA